MNRNTKHRLRRRGYWPEVEATFGDLPPELFRQGLLLQHDLATAYSDSGQFEDIVSRADDYPLLDLHDWLLDDWRLPEGQARAGLERRLGLGMVFTFCAVYTHESLLDEATHFDERYHLLEQALTQRARHHFAQLFPEPSPFWENYRAFMGEYVQAISEQAGSVEEARQHLGHKLSFAKIPAVAAAMWAGEEDTARLTALLSMLDSLNGAVQVRQEIFNIRRDLGRGHYTYPILRVMREAGIEPGQPVTPERILGAMLLTGAVDAMAEEGLTRLKAGRAAAHGLGLPTFDAYFVRVEDQFRGLRELFSLKGPPTSPQLGVSFAPARDSLSQAIQMAEAYLLSDRTFRESWEVQRRGFFGMSEWVGKAFAPGLIVEVLCQHRADTAELVGEVFGALAENEFRYYPHHSVPPDADDLGLALRLFRYSAEKDAHRQLLQTPLRWMVANLSESGEIPCWFTRQVETLSSEYTGVLWGNHCATVEANLLLGLMDYDGEAYRDLVEKAAARWLERWLVSGLGGNTLYVAPYALWTVCRLLTTLSVRPIPEAMRAKIGQASEQLFRRLKKEAGNVTTPQEAAFLTLACTFPLAESLFNPGWIGLMLKNQSYDGSWAGEPLFVTPTRGEVAAWYTSCSVTTAFCYHALKLYARRK